MPGNWQVRFLEGLGLATAPGYSAKPAPEDAPSHLAMVGRYIFTPALMTLLKDVRPGRDNEVQLTDAIAALARQEPVYGVLLDGQRFDAGTPEGFLQANAILGLQHEVYGEAFRKALKNWL